MAKPTKAQLTAQLDELGVEHDPTQSNAELKALLAEHDASGDEPDEEGEGDPDIVGLDDDDDDDDEIDPTVEGLSGDDDDDDGLTDEDFKTYKRAVKRQGRSTVVLPKQPELTPHGKKPIFVLEQIPCLLGGKRLVLEPGKHLPKGVLGQGQIARLMGLGKLSAKKPKARGARRSLLD